jgi:hypothetical protein
MLHACPIALNEFKEQSTSTEAQVIKNVPEFYETWKLTAAAHSTPPPPSPSTDPDTKVTSYLTKQKVWLLTLVTQPGRILLNTRAL